MSVREPPECDLHVTINNGQTMVSTNPQKPSRLPVLILAQTGLPNGKDTVVVGDLILHVKFPKGDDNYVLVWAEQMSTSQSGGGGSCALS